jgi:hypothetical protein
MESTKTHCGGCGFSHEHRILAVEAPREDARDILRQFGLKRAHVGFNRDGLAVTAGSCCRDVREALASVGGGYVMWTCDISDEQADAEAAAEEAYERQYASSYGLGL